MPTPVVSGKAWEYALAVEFRNVLNSECVLRPTSAKTKAENSYTHLSVQERPRLTKAANEVAVFLKSHDPRTVTAQSIEIQSDQKGAIGDVRDILIHTPNSVIGVSAKNRHAAIKSPRLSHSLDFGKVWYGQPCSERYWGAVETVFEDLKSKQGTGTWRDDLPNKEEWYYLPILNAFVDEVSTCTDLAKMIGFLLGTFPFYKVIKVNGTVKIQSFNLDGSLRWGTKIELPRKIVHIERSLYTRRDMRKWDTVIMYLDQGWQLSFRLHNASSKIEPSVKFDVNLVGAPVTLSCHEIPFG